MSNAIEICKITLTYNDGTVFTERVPKTEKTNVLSRFKPSLALTLSALSVDLSSTETSSK